MKALHSSSVTERVFMKKAAEKVPDFRSLFEAVPGLYLVLLPDLTIVAVSNAYLEATHTQRKAILGRHLFDVFPDNPNDPNATGVANLSASLERVLRNKTPDSMPLQKYDIPLPESEGGGFEERYWSPLNTPVLDTKQKVKYIIHRVEDVTEFVRLKNLESRHDDISRKLHDSEKRYVQNLRESEERFRLLVETIKDYAIIMIDPEGRVASWNEGAERINGYTADEMIGKHISIFYPSEDVEHNVPIMNLQEAREHGRFEHVGWRVRKNGLLFWAEVVLTALYDAKGKLRGYTKITRDITEQKLTEEYLRDSRQQLETILNNAPNAIVVIDEASRIVNWNARAEEMFGWTAAETTGQVMSGLIIPERYRDAHTAGMQRYLRTGVANVLNRPIELIALRRNNEEFPIELRISSTRVNEHTLFIAFVSDITERKKAEEHINLLNQELASNVSELEAANRELEAFSYSVSHDLRAPLRAVHGYMRILESEYAGAVDAEGQDLMHRVQDNAQKMGRLIDDLLEFSRLGKRELQKMPVDMTEIAKGVLNEIAIQPHFKASTTLHQLPSAVADRSLMVQVLTNLLSNAVKYSQPIDYPAIEIGSFRENQNVVYFVRDNGVGFDMRYYNKLFGVFQRLHSAREFDGTGVGLALVKRIINRHGGEVWAESEPGNGATFYFTIEKRSHTQQPS